MARTRLEWAQWMAEKGISVFIVEPNSKRPLDGYSWYLRQSTSADVIDGWFDQIPNCNYGLHLGEKYVVIDLDVKPDANGVKEFEELCAEHGVEDFLLQFDTLIVRTPGGGFHLYFEAPFPCGLANDFAKGIDVRGATGYVVGPGSADSRGEWELINDAEIAPLPDFLADYIRPPGHKDPNHDVPVIDLDLDENVQYALDWLKEREPAVQGQNGDDHTYETVQFLRDFGLSEGKIFEVLNSGWNQRCDPPWGDDELDAKIRNAWAYGQNRPGVKSPTWKAQRVVLAHGQGIWADHLTDEAKAEMFHPTAHLRLAVDNTRHPEDDEIPEDVEDDEVDPVTGETASSFPWADVLDFMKKDAVREYVIYNWLLAHGVTHMIAKRGTGKSTVALNMAFHIACDMDWCGIPTQPGWKVIYICGEDDVGMRLNCRAWVKHYGQMPDPSRFLVAEDIIKLTDPQRLVMRVREMVEWAGNKPTVVILDTWQRATSGWAKNDQEDMEKAVENAEFVAKHLRGPLLSCVHPPKDGRMTVVGSGVQEDTSAGIYHLEAKSDGVRLFIDRIKGPGRGRWMNFQLKNVELEGLDKFGHPLNGLVAVKTGGSEDDDTVEQVDKREREMRAWATAIRGCNRYPAEVSIYDPLPSLNVKNVAEFLMKIIEDSADDTSEAHFEAQAFIGQYLEPLTAFIDGGLRTLTFKKISDRLYEFFHHPKVPPEVTTTDGYWRMKYVPKAKNVNKTSKNPQKVFVFGENVIDK